MLESQVLFVYVWWTALWRSGWKSEDQELNVNAQPSGILATVFTHLKLPVGNFAASGR